MSAPSEPLDPALQLDRLLKQRFGFPSFRPGQREAIEELLRGGRLLCIQPTGHGKSLLYQLTTLLLDGITLVISPLLALMRDQLGHLEQRFGISAAAINSDQTEEENAQARRAALDGRIRLLFVAPEQLDHVDRFEFLRGLPVSLLVVDEAHCISTWGHDFRPAYRQIVQLLRALEERRADIRVLGLTATAEEQTETDIKSQFEGGRGLPVAVHREAMDRPNLRLAVVPVTGMAQKLVYLEQLLGRTPGEGLIYCATRENTEILAAYLSGRGRNVTAYHAGMDPEVKRALQQDFIQGRYQAITATNALGMGIDKANLRYVVHADVPGSITAYYQEVGRAGRDGEPALGILLFDPADRRIQQYFIDSAQPTPQDFQAVLSVIQVADGVEPPNLMGIKTGTGLHPTRVTVVVAELAEQGFLEKKSQSGRQIYLATGRDGAPDLSRYENQLTVRTRELERMMDYGNLQVDCLMAALRHALGDETAQACGRCSLCRGASSGIIPDPEAVAQVEGWLGERPVPIAASRRGGHSEGLALLNSELRTPAFAHFMRNRAQGDAGPAPAPDLPPELAERMRAQLRRLGATTALSAVVPVPSRTWAQRETTARLAAETLGVPALPGLLVWGEEPPARQGELRNNDQRRDNVRGRMRCAGAQPPPGAILLLDDYIGSGATLREAARALRKQGRFEGPIIPFTLARVRWRLGARGMV